MARMIRKQMYLEAAQDRRLKRIAAGRGVPEAVIVREAIERLPETPNLARVPPGSVPDPLEYARRLLAQGPLPRRRRDWTREQIYRRF